MHLRVNPCKIYQFSPRQVLILDEEGYQCITHFFEGGGQNRKIEKRGGYITLITPVRLKNKKRRKI